MGTNGRIIATATVPILVEECLSPFGRIEVAQSDDEATLASLVCGAVGIIARGTSRISAAVIAAADRLQVIGRSGAGFESVDIEAATRRGIPVVYTPGAPTRGVAEAALAMILALAKRLPMLDRATKSGNWNIRYKMVVSDVEAAILGIVGLGSIGSELARMAAALGMRVIAYDPVAPASRFESLGVERAELDELLARSDYVSLHTPLNNSTRGLFDRQRLQCMKRGAVLINLARGGLFNQLDDIHEALCAGHLAAVGLDVFPEEPPDVRHPLFSHPNVLCTPHLAAGSERTMHRIFAQMAEGMAAIFRGEQPPNVVNPQVFATKGSQTSPSRDQSDSACDRTMQPTV